MSFWDEIRKIPPVTRFLCGSSLAVSVPVMMQVVAPYQVVFIKDLVTRRFEVWRVFTSFFLGSSGINYIFDLVMLYRNSDQLESSHYARRSADYAWQLLLASLAILALNIPLRAVVHTRPLLLALTYLSARLAPPGASTSLFGLLSLPLEYLPYALVAMDLVLAGPAAAAQALSGVLVGHLWWWGAWQGAAPRTLGIAPAWLRRVIGDGPGAAGGAVGGVHVVPPPRVREEAERATGHRWGSGHRLGES
ncbi:DER1-domain-containing protein [Amylocystis lapponica]|nr:DER1-domain-containing protein [Amylocystis lapponica]